jgi:transcriptional antiterminator NusG
MGMTEIETVEQVPEKVEETPVVVKDERFKWYAVLTQSGMEKKAKTTLEDRVRKLGLQDFVKQVVVPALTEEYIDEHGKKKTREKKMMPGYLLVQMEMTDRTFHCVKETPKVSTFIGGAHNKMPPPLGDDEVDRLLNTAKQAAKEPIKPKLTFEKGDRVRVVDGPFTSFVGDVEEVKPEKQKLRLLILVFGRATPVEIEFSKVEKVREEKAKIEK